MYISEHMVFWHIHKYNNLYTKAF